MHQASVLLHTVLDNTQVQDTVGIFGTAFKADTPVITASPAITLIGGLLHNFVDVLVYDRLAEDATRELFGDTINYAQSIERCIHNSDVCVLTYRSKELKEAFELININKPKVIIDCWRQLDTDKLDTNFKVIGIGVNT